MRPTYPSLPADIAHFSGACAITSYPSKFQALLSVGHGIDPTIQALHDAATTPQQRFAVTDTPNVESPKGHTALFAFNPVFTCPR
jgi:hypothetical protein